jgi:uncharacterized RDD family membrane protein YckC
VPTAVFLERIQAVDLSGNRIGFWRATTRHFAKFLSSLFFGLGFLIIDFTKHKQGMHDMVARTLVVVKPKALVSSNGSQRGQLGS